jgi:hypothetical protein
VHSSRISFAHIVLHAKLKWWTTVPAIPFSSFKFYLTKYIWKY